MWHIFLRDCSDTELLTSPIYNNKIKELINKITHMKVEFVFYTSQEKFINVGNRPIIQIQEFIQNYKYMHWDDEDYLSCLKELENEINKTQS